MACNYLIPTISALPIGYDCTIPIVFGGIARRTILPECHIIIYHRVYHEGEIVDDEERKFLIKSGEVVGELPEPLVWRDAENAWGEHPGFLELGCRSADGRDIFATKSVLAFYAIYTKPGKKSFFSDNAYKYGAPPVISQIANFGQYIDGHPVIHLDSNRDLGETITLINPYKKLVVGRIVTHDGRSLKRIHVPPLSARNVRLAEMLRHGESEWFGQVQMTASNRLITYNVKHSLRDPRVISDHEHLDPFRADPTHLPAFQIFRQRLGKYIKVYGWR